MNIFSAVFPISVQNDYDLAENIQEKSHYILLIFTILGTKAVIDTERHRNFLSHWNIFCNISNFRQILYWLGRKLIEKHFIFHWFLLFQILWNKSLIDTERQRYLLWYANILSNISNCCCRSDLAENIQQKSHYTFNVFSLSQIPGTKSVNRYRKIRIFSVICEYFLR